MKERAGCGFKRFQKEGWTRRPALTMILTNTHVGRCHIFMESHHYFPDK